MDNSSQGTGKVTKISIQDVIDFSFCPKFYRYKKDGELDRTLNTFYNENIKRAFFKYLRSEQTTGNNNKSFNRLKTSIGRTFATKKDLKDIIFSTEKTSRTKTLKNALENKRRLAIDAIIAFRDFVEKEPQNILAVDMPYEIRIGKSIILTGTFHYIREVFKQVIKILDKYNNDQYDNPTGDITEEKEIQIVRFEPYRDKHLTNLKRHDLELTAMYYAFNQLFNIKKNPVILHCDLYRRKVTTTKRTEDDINDLIKTIQSVVICLNNGLELYSPDDKCSFCVYHNKCLRY